MVSVRTPPSDYRHSGAHALALRLIGPRTIRFEVSFDAPPHRMENTVPTMEMKRATIQGLE
jgi:hypothetical protein